MNVFVILCGLYLQPVVYVVPIDDSNEDPMLYNLTVDELKEIDPWYREHAE